MRKITIINGPNLNLLGNREEEIYGKKSFNDVKKELEKIVEGKAEVEYYQSNHEGEIIDKIHECMGDMDYMIINPGALTHYSYGIYDAILASKIKVIEVHISNIFSREQWRGKSVISPAVTGVISGLGMDVYKLAVMYILDKFKE
ncbi:MAG: type II 3-dehydroquinate dehydratase [Actinomycetota bacterium]|nr:type II 3-dehydroquinate dehydratase [Actinomycetota bacterium]